MESCLKEQDVFWDIKLAQDARPVIENSVSEVKIELDRMEKGGII